MEVQDKFPFFLFSKQKRIMQHQTPQ